MFNYKKVLMILLIMVGTTISAQWIKKDSGVSVNLFDVCFVDSLYGWAIGDSSIIITTKDGGESWSQQTNPDSVSSLNKIQFIDRDVGYIIGNEGLILKSNNGGLGWQKLNSDYTYNLSDLSFVNETIGWISGWEETPQTRAGVILHTSDGGVSWEKQVEIISDFLFGSTLFMAVTFLDDSIGWALGGDYADNFSSTFTYFTNNAGKSWDTIGVWENSPQHRLKVISYDTLWCGGITFLISSDSGNSWQDPNEEGKFVTPFDISPFSGQKGWIIHENLLTKENRVLYTSNAGKKWDIEIDLTNSPANAITNINGKQVWIVGDSGLVMKRKNVTSINTNYKKSIQNNIQIKNYPNPFNSETIIEYYLPKPSNVDLSIYNILGQKLEPLVIQKQKAGKYKIEFDGSGFSSGVFFCALQTDEQKTMQKIIMIK